MLHPHPKREPELQQFSLSAFQLFYLAHMLICLESSPAITEELPSVMGSEILPSSDPNTREDSHFPSVFSAFPQRELGQWKSSGCFPHTSLAPVPILHILPYFLYIFPYFLHIFPYFLYVFPYFSLFMEEHNQAGIAKAEAPAQEPSPHEGCAVEQLLSVCDTSPSSFVLGNAALTI